MNRKYSKLRPKRITRAKYFVYGGPKQVDFVAAVKKLASSLDPLNPPKLGLSGGLSTEGAMDIASGALNAFASGLNALAEKNHLNYLLELLNLLFSNELWATGVQQAQLNLLALQLAKDFRIQQLEELSKLMMNNLTFGSPAKYNGLNLPNKFMIGGLISAGIAVDSAAGKAIGGEYQSGVGNALSALPGGGLIGGTLNRLFGMKTNLAELNRVKQDQAALANLAATASVATSFDDTSLSSPTAINTNVNAYEGGVFSKGKAARKNAELLLKLLTALDYAERTAQSSITNILQSLDDMLASTFAAYGGKLGGFYGNSNKFDDGGPIFNPFTREWTGYDGKPLKRKHDKSFGYTVYTDDGFAVNYNHKGREIGRKKGTQTPSITGKTRNIQELKYFDRNQELSDSVKVISKRYGVNPNLVASRIGREIVDTAIEHYNDTGGKEFLTNQDLWAVGPTWGLDDTYSRILSGDVKIKEPWVKLEKLRFTNEHGRETESVYGRKWSDMVSATAAELAARREVIKKKFPNMTDKQLDAAASASFNLGESGAIKAIKKRGASAVSKYTPFIELKAQGGPLNTHGGSFTNGLTFINNGGTHEANPYEGVPMGVDSLGVPNLVEEGEVIFNDYVFSNRLKVPKGMKKKYKLGTKSSLSFADAAMKLAKESEERPNDPISLAGLDATMLMLMQEQEKERAKKEDIKNNTFAKGGKLGTLYGGPGAEDQFLDHRIFGYKYGNNNNGKKYLLWLEHFPTITSESLPSNISNVDYNRLSPLHNANLSIGKNNKITPEELLDDNLVPYALHSSNFFKVPLLNSDKPVSNNKSVSNDELNLETLRTAPTWMRYAPVIGSGIMSLTDMMGLTNKPDYTDADTLANVATLTSKYNPISFNPVGNYLTYNPFDIEFAANLANAESAAARRALLNTSGGNRALAMAGILSADLNALNLLGILRRGAAEDNLKLRQLVEDFNRATNMFNSEGQFKADAANLEAQSNAMRNYLMGMNSAVELRLKERMASLAARSANLSNFINSLGDIGKENFARNMVVSDPSKYYTIDNNGQVSYKKNYLTLDDDAKSEVDAEIKEKLEKIKKSLKSKKGGR